MCDIWSSSAHFAGEPSIVSFAHGWRAQTATLARFNCLSCGCDRGVGSLNKAKFILLHICANKCDVGGNKGWFSDHVIVSHHSSLPSSHASAQCVKVWAWLKSLHLNSLVFTSMKSNFNGQISCFWSFRHWSWFLVAYRWLDYVED